MAAAAPFLFISCQMGAERAVKEEMARLWPAFRFAYSRPGFLTFKLPIGHGLAEDFDLKSVFARAFGFALGKASGTTAEERADEVWRLADARAYDRLHVWPRDAAAPGEHGYAPGLTDDSRAAAGLILARRPDFPHNSQAPTVEPAKTQDMVLDCVLVEPEVWWVGYHRVSGVASGWPGGMCELRQPADAVSRAYLKMEESLRWSQLPIVAGSRCVELGCAPGGSSQALLNRGAIVTGIDPAAMHETLLAHPNFTHIRKRSADVRRREFRKTRWLTADMNVAPGYTLDTVEAIVTYPETKIRGLLLTLKFPEWELASNVPEYLARIRSWGYEHVVARQLQYNRQEICVAALARVASRRPSARRRPMRRHRR